MTGYRFCGEEMGAARAPVPQLSSPVPPSHRTALLGCSAGLLNIQAPWRDLNSDPCGQPCPMAFFCTPSPLPRPTVPGLHPHGATPTPNHRDREPGQPEAELGGGTSGPQTQLQANILSTSLLLSGPQFTHLEIRDGGSLISRALTILTVSSAYLHYTV